MNDLIHIDLTEHERDILLKGLRFVRSSIKLETRDPSAQDELRRSGLLDEVQILSQRLEASSMPTTTEI
jgi:hypothetical protein